MRHLNSARGEIEASKVHILTEIMEYMPNAIVSKTIIKKPTGNITVMSFDTGEELTQKASPFGSFVQIIDGSAEITINKQQHVLQSGEGIIIPAHATNKVKATQRFKMILTLIKSGYEA